MIKRKYLKVRNRTLRNKHNNNNPKIKWILMRVILLWLEIKIK